MDFGKYLKELREKASLTQEEAAKKMEVSTTSIQNWEYNKNHPEIENLNIIAKIYNIDFSILVDVLNKSLNNLDADDKSKRKLQYEYLLSSKFDIEKFKKIDFTEKEKDLFTAFALNISLCNHPLPTLFKQTQTSLEASLFIDKIKDLGLIEINSDYKITDYFKKYSIELSERGEYLLELIKSNQYFDIYSLKIDNLLMLASKFALINNLHEKLKLLKFIHENKLYLIKTVKDENNTTLVDYPFQEYTSNNYRYYSDKVKFIERLPLVLEDDYYELIKEESSNEEYLASKEVYLKKLEVYEANKDLLEDMNKPTFNEVYVEYVKLSEKGEKLYNALVESGYYNKEEDK